MSTNSRPSFSAAAAEGSDETEVDVAERRRADRERSSCARTRMFRRMADVEGMNPRIVAEWIVEDIPLEHAVHCLIDVVIARQVGRREQARRVVRAWWTVVAVIVVIAAGAWLVIQTQPTNRETVLGPSRGAPTSRQP